MVRLGWVGVAIACLALVRGAPNAAPPSPQARAPRAPGAPPSSPSSPSGGSADRNTDKECRDYEEKCGKDECCNTWDNYCNTYKTDNNGKQKEVHVCADDHAVLSSDRLAEVLFFPFIFTILLLVLTLLSAKNGFGNSGESGIIGKLMVAFGCVTAFLCIFQLYTPNNFNALLIAMMGLTSAWAATTSDWRIILFAFVYQISIFLLWRNPFASNMFLGTQGNGIVYNFISWTTEAVTGGGSSCSTYYRSYFDHSMGDEKDTNNAIPRWGFCGRHWLSFNFVMVIIQIAMNVGLLVCTFLHLNGASAPSSSSTPSKGPIVEPLMTNEQ